MRPSWFVVALIFGTVTPSMYTLASLKLDRTPPYERVSGEIIPTTPEDCGLPTGSADTEVRAGGCVAVTWVTRELRSPQSCVPASDFGHVTRVIMDSRGVTHEVPKMSARYGPGRLPFTPTISRPFVYPDWGLPGGVPGPAVYYSRACFVCKAFESLPLAEWNQNPFQRADPVCLDTPTISHIVMEARR